MVNIIKKKYYFVVKYKYYILRSISHDNSYILQMLLKNLKRLVQPQSATFSKSCHLDHADDDNVWMTNKIAESEDATGRQNATTSSNNNQKTFVQQPVTSVRNVLRPRIKLKQVCALFSLIYHHIMI